MTPLSYPPTTGRVSRTCALELDVIADTAMVQVPICLGIDDDGRRAGTKTPTIDI